MPITIVNLTAVNASARLLKQSLNTRNNTGEKQL
jgi:hypothetical protein